MDTHSQHDSLYRLHAYMAHHARLLRDLQQVRIAAGNRLGKLDRDGMPPTFGGRPILEDVSDLPGVDAAENGARRELERLAKQHPMYEWVKNTRGLGLAGFGLIVGAAGPLDRFPTVSKFWAYMGMHVKEGVSPRRKKGEKANWSNQGRTTCFQLGEAIVKVGGPYREKYDQKKAEYLARDRVGPSECPFGQVHKDSNGKIYKCGLAHAHAAAKRYAVKELLKDMWVEWQHRVVMKAVA